MVSLTYNPSVPLEFDSAGTAGYHIGDPPDARSVQAARRRGYDLSALRARQLQTADFKRFDLLLAMDEENLVEMQALAPQGGAGRAKLFLTGKTAPKGGPLIDTKTYACEGAAGSYYCKASYEPLPKGTYMWRISWAGMMPAHVELTLRW